MEEIENAVPENWKALGLILLLPLRSLNWVLESSESHFK